MNKWIKRGFKGEWTSLQQAKSLSPVGRVPMKLLLAKFSNPRRGHHVGHKLAFIPVRSPDKEFLFRYIDESLVRDDMPSSQVEVS